jgi:bacterioferritin-associated ferredoxin
MRIDRCVCFHVTFAEIREFAASRVTTTEADVQDRFGCGQKCGTCVPYLRRTLRTGQTVFHQLLSDLDEPAPRG